MSKLKGKLDKITSASSSRWKENAQYRKNNKWLRYSSEIARRVLAAIDGNKNLNQAKLAAQLNVSSQQVSKIIKGQENLTLESIYKLSQALGVELINFPAYSWSEPLYDSMTPSYSYKVIGDFTKTGSLLRGAVTTTTRETPSVLTVFGRLAETA